MSKSIKSLFVSCLVIFSFLVLAPNIFAITETSEKDMLLVFDASGSMSEQFGGVSRIDSLKTAVGSLLDSLDDTVMVGLRPFAQVKKATEAEACLVTNLAQKFTSERSIIKTQTSLLQAVGSYTPLAYTLKTSAGDFAVGNDNVLVLLTDGRDTCGGDPAKEAGILFNSTKKIKVYVIGMGVDSDTKNQLSLIASNGGGVYYDASDSNSLTSSLNAIQKLEQPKVRLETLEPLGGIPKNGGDGFSDAEVVIKDTDYRLENSLAPGQYAYFRFQPNYYIGAGDKVRNFKVTFTLLGDRRGVSYDPTSNSFQESNLHNYRMEFFDDKSFPTVNPIEVTNVNTLRKTFVINSDQCTGGPKAGSCYIKIGSKDFAISKYDMFKFEIAKEGEVATATNGAGSETVGDNNHTMPVIRDQGPSIGSLIYLLLGIIVVLIIVVGVTLYILFKKKKAASIGSIPTQSIPPPPQGPIQ